MTRQAVINASPLIFLSRGHHLSLLEAVAERVLVPEPVVLEIRAKGADDLTVRALDTTSWLQPVPAPFLPDEIIEWGLGAGESAVLALAKSIGGGEAIIDDLAARRCAAVLGIPVRGTLGIVLLAKKRGLIPAARPVLEDLIRGGLYLHESVLAEALRRVRE